MNERTHSVRLWGYNVVRISKLEIENHSRIADVKLDVRTHLVLVGANDVGKSSVLRCLQLALGASTGQLYSQITSEDFRDAAQPLVVEVTLVDFTTDDQAAFPDEINDDPAGGPSTMTVRLTATVDVDETVAIERIAVGSGTNRQLSRQQLEAIGWRFLTATAQSRDLRSERRTALTDLLAAVELGTEQQDFDDAIATLAETLSDSKVLKQVRKDLASQMTKALPHRLKAKDLAFVPGSSAEKDPLSDVRLQVLRDGELRDLAAQSDGTRALYAIALYDLTSAGANVVGIDEPEIHLHPTSQRSLAKLLRSSNSQKILATHSPDIVGAFDSDSIVVVRPGGRIVQPKAGFLSADERMTVRWWVRDRLEPLTSSRVVAVEGLADRIVVERAAELTDRALDRLGVSILEANGFGDMGAIDTLFGKDGFDVPLSMLIDADAEKAVAKRLGVAVADLNARSVWVSTADLEDEYVRAIGAVPLAAALLGSALFKPNEIAALTATGEGGTYTDKDVAQFCRSKKVQSSLVAVSLMTESEARAVSSVEGMLAQIEALL